MVKNILIIICSCFIYLLSAAQTGSNLQWAFIKGDSTLNIAGIYGTKGIAAITNKPGARQGGVSWTDASGNFWMFGGQGFDFANTLGSLNDLWKYELSTNQWTWINGDDTVNADGVYGTMGIAASTNKPGNKINAVSWKDNAGNLWMFGGSGVNDLWKYNISTNKWTWIKGDSSLGNGFYILGVYGTKSVAAAANTPGARTGAISWTDNSGNLWLFGGIGQGATYSNVGAYLNDLWKYDPSINQWTWMNGDSTLDIKGIYGIQGIADAANKPGGRWLGVSWTDHSGDLWMFGGEGLPASYCCVGWLLTDLWKYHPTTNQWTWVKGDNNSISEGGIYGTQGIAAAANHPGGRYGSISWTDPDDNLWLLGGSGYVTTGTGSYLNDLWKYDPSSNQWVWVNGDNIIPSPPGVYGVQGNAAPANTPGGRYFNISWTDHAGNLWTLGGIGYASGPTYLSDGPAYLNDLWKFNNSTTVPLKLINISAIAVQKSILVNWQTAQEINTKDFIVERSADAINFSAIGKVDAEISSVTTHSYHYTDNAPLQGINFYRLKMEDKDDRFTYSNVIRVNHNSRNEIIIAPNPVADYTTISFTLLQKQKTRISIYDMAGRLVKILANAELKAGTYELPWNAKYEKGTAVSAGIYFLKMQAGNFYEIKKLVVVK